MRAKLALAVTLVAAVCMLQAHGVPTLQPTARQFTGDDLLGKYDLFVKQGNCPNTITHINYTAVPLDHEGITYNAFAITHPGIQQEDVQCTSVGQFAIVPNQLIDAAGYRNALGETAPVVKDLIAQEAEFLVGVELVYRECGNTHLAANALAIFIEQEKMVRVPGLITLYPGARYMVIYVDDSPTPCTYFQQIPGRTIGEALSEPGSEPPGGAAIDGTESIYEPGTEPTSSTGTNGETSGILFPGSTPGTLSSTGAVAGAGGSAGDGKSGAGAGISSGSSAGISGMSSSDTGAALADTVTEGSEAFSYPEESPEGEEEGTGSVCFHGDVTVELEGGENVRMADLQLGSRVHVGDGKYSTVFMFTHADAELRTIFVELNTETGQKLTLTPGHYLYVNGVLAAAGSVQVGDFLGSARVIEVARRQLTGVYNPQTEHGDIIVNGIKASTYTQTVHPHLAHSLLAPIRAVFHGLGVAQWMRFEMGSDAVARFAPKGAQVLQ